MTGRVFLNYRRADAEAWADRLFERLIRQFPRENVFMDIDGNIPFGFPWAQWLDSQVAACDLMLVLIGRTWVAEFQARADPDERDFVRVEIESVLARKIPVVPVFLGDASVPRSADLPESVRPLMALQAARLQRLSFDADAEVLITGIARSIALARGEAVAVAPLRQRQDPAARYRAEGRIRIEAAVIEGAPDGWFLPGNGKSEWFADVRGGPEMVVVPAGSFMMGSPPEEIAALKKEYPSVDAAWFDAEGPQREVMIAQAFAIGRHAVTRGQFAAFVEATGRKMPDEAWTWEDGKGELRKGRSWRNPGFAQDESHPVVCVSWEDAQAYAEWLSGVTGKPYRLPSEAEWECAARAGTKTPFWWGPSITTQQANYDGNSTFRGSPKGEYRKATVPVQSFAANPWGLLQVHGNVWEWCEDVWHPAFSGDAPRDGSAWLKGGDALSRVLRGGSWYNIPQFLRAAQRNLTLPGLRGSGLGFRLARTLPPTS
jgi:formylglycine-generating enzyme required for sulfatase activity